MRIKTNKILPKQDIEPGTGTGTECSQDCKKDQKKEKEGTKFLLVKPAPNNQKRKQIVV